MLIFLLACAHTPEPAAVAEVPPDKAAMVRVHMSENFDRATNAKDEVVMGMPDRARADLAWLGENLATDALGEPGVAFLTSLKMASAEAAKASTSTDLGAGIGQVVATCSTCHAHFGVALSPLVATKPETGGHAATASWAVGALWTGVLANTDAAWNTGAADLAAEVQQLQSYAAASPGADAAGGLARLTELATTAPAAADRDARSKALGQVVGACGSCHVEALKHN